MASATIFLSLRSGRSIGNNQDSWVKSEVPTFYSIDISLGADLLTLDTIPIAEGVGALPGVQELS